jgi:hypothetical protein
MAGQEASCLQQAVGAERPIAEPGIRGKGDHRMDKVALMAINFSRRSTRSCGLHRGTYVE